MPAVFVHGVPDTHRVWDAVLQRIDRDDAVALSLPGFGVPPPPDFAATKEAYAAWLVSEIERFEEPVDIVGHDWGAMLTMRAASLVPERIRTWVAGGGPVDPEYTWHEVAQLWQQPEVGEQVMAAFGGETLAQGLTGLGVPADAAAETVARVDDTMKDCILKLYRSAVHVGAEWAPDFANITATGLLIWGDQDPYADTAMGQRMAQWAGARFELLEGCGHWWPEQRPADVARLIQAHWRGV